MAKSYTNEQYLAYANYILEGDAAAVASDEAEGGGISSQFKKLIAGAAISGTGAVACLAYLHQKYGIKDIHGLSKYFQMLCKRIGNGPVGKILGTIASGVSAALLWANKMVKPLADKVADAIGGKYGALANKPISYSNGFFGFGAKASPYSYGSCVCLTVAACAVAAVLYKVYKVIRSKVAEGETKAAYYARIQEGVNVAVMESKAMFSDLTQVIEGDLAGKFAKAMPGLFKGMGYSDAEIAALTGARKTGEGFIQKMQGKVMEMWEWVTKAAKANKVLAIMIAICAACVCCWVGLRKFMSSSAVGEPTTEAAIAKKANKGASAAKKMAAKPKAVKSVKAKSNIKAAAKKMASKKK